VLLAGWKLAYYGELLPTAFYSKSAANPYVTQGISYMLLYLLKNWFLLVAGALALGAFALRKPVLAQTSRADDGLLLGSAALFTAYLVWVGGDFMFARRILPVAPLVFWALESRIVALPTPRARGLAAAAVLAAAALPAPLYASARVIDDVADERSFYPREIVEARRRQGELVGRLLAGTPARVAIEGGLLSFAYYSNLPYVVETSGLTQYSLAKLPLERRGAIGHEKRATADWLRANGIHFLVPYEPPPVAREPGPPRMDIVFFGGNLAKAHLLYYEDAVMEPLRGRPQVEFVPIERVVAQTLREMRAAPPERAEELYAILREFYLRGAGERGAEWDRELRALLVERRASR
jgi:hypothetical protein